MRAGHLRSLDLAQRFVTRWGITLIAGLLRFGELNKRRRRVQQCDFRFEIFFSFSFSFRFIVRALLYYL